MRRAGLLLAIVPIFGCTRLLTEGPDPKDTFDSPLPGLTRDELRTFFEGDENFGIVFTEETGLGPIFVRPSCSHCHIADGRGSPDEIVVRFSMGTNLALAIGGDQLQPHSITGVPGETLPPGVDFSLRLPPPVFGVGLLESIPEAAILANADPDDLDFDGISGRPAWREPAEYVPATVVGGGEGPQLGRFGWKANFTSLTETIGHAYHQDMGLTSDLVPVEESNPQHGGISVGDFVADPELTGAHVARTLFYVRLLAPPGRGAQTSSVESGETLFTTIGCAKCHIPSMTTGPNAIEALSNVEVNLYSDLLLHDMGPELADNRVDGPASGSEWRTRPLWGTRLVREFLDGEEWYLHDGRAESLEDAILAHGGEALDARDTFAALDEDARDDVIAFLRSL